MSDCVRLLVVEDEPQVRQLYATWAEMLGWFVRSAETLYDASEINRLEGPFDVMLLDLSLPNGIGPATVDQAIRWAPAIIVATGNDDHEVRTECLRRGVEYFVTKSELSKDALGRCVEYALARREGFRRRLNEDYQEKSAERARREEGG